MTRFGALSTSFHLSGSIPKFDWDLREMIRGVYQAFRAAFVLAPRYLKLTRSGDHRGALQFLNMTKASGALSLPWRVAVIHECGMLGDYTRVIEVCKEAGLDLSYVKSTSDHNERYLIAFAVWWCLVARDKTGLGEASTALLDPYLHQVDLSKVIGAYKKAFPLTPHPNWRV